MKHCTEQEFRDLVTRFDHTNGCRYGQYGIQFWNGKLIAWDRTGTYKLKELFVGCHGDAVNKLRTFLDMVDMLEDEAVASAGGAE